jgi:hypothetical protein
MEVVEKYVRLIVSYILENLS